MALHAKARREVLSESRMREICLSGSICVPTFRLCKSCQRHCCRRADVSDEFNVVSCVPSRGLAARQDAKTAVIECVVGYNAERGLNDPSGVVAIHGIDRLPEQVSHGYASLSLCVYSTPLF
jgi:hypothetical protein